MALVALWYLPSALAQPQPGPPVRAITRITGDLYRVQNNQHYTVFLVTPAGIVLADPISVDAAIWIKAQLAERFPNTPVRYVLYSITIRTSARRRRLQRHGGDCRPRELQRRVGRPRARTRLREALRGRRPPESTTADAGSPGGKTVQMIHPGRIAMRPTRRRGFSGGASSSSDHGRQDGAWLEHTTGGAPIAGTSTRSRR
jgi:hypothetical protein